jgi:hypothetical protein
MAPRLVPTNKQVAETVLWKEGLSGAQHQRALERLVRQLESDDLDFAWTFNQWVRAAGSALVAGGGTVAAAFIVAGVPLGYQATASFYIAYAILLGAACLLYRLVAITMSPDHKRPRVLAAEVLFLGLALTYLFYGIGTAVFHDGWFGPKSGWPIHAYTFSWWRPIAGSFLAACVGMAFRYSADKTARQIDERRVALAAASTQAERRAKSARSVRVSREPRSAL